jgi:hypothetical protein
MRSKSKKLIIGVDEAGYGPNLGPLLIGGSAWLVPESLDEQRFSQSLAHRFRPSSWFADCQHVPLGDSKRLYQAGSGLATLEIGLLSLLASLDKTPKNLAQLMRQMGASPDQSKLDQLSQSTEVARTGRLCPAPIPAWYENLADYPVPSQANLLPEIHRLNDLAMLQLQSTGTQLLSVQATAIDEAAFNLQLDRFGSKGLLLSLATLQLVERLIEAAPADCAIEVFCDRQGGRKNYLPILAQWQPDRWFQELRVSARRCSYRTVDSLRSILVHFTVSGDSFAPTALASMAAKYLRERLMESFNRYWSGLCPDIKPTAGYPVDAARFRQQIEGVALQQSLSENSWWRRK